MHHIENDPSVIQKISLTAEALGMGNVMLSYIFSGRQLANCSHFAAERIRQHEQMEI